MALLMFIVIEYFTVSYCAFMYAKTQLQLIITIDDFTQTLNNTGGQVDAILHDFSKSL